MNKQTLQLTLIAIILVLAQAIVFNHVCLFNVAVPFVFIYVIIKLPVTLNVNWVLTVGFFLGLAVDIFSDTYGMNALACTLLAALRRPLLHLYLPRGEELTDPIPSLRSPGVAVFVKYTLTMAFFYSFLIFLIEAFTFFNFLKLLLAIFSSTILSSILLIALDSLVSYRNAKRL